MCKECKVGHLCWERNRVAFYKCGWGIIWKTLFFSHFWPFLTPTDKLNVNDIWWYQIISIKLNCCINYSITSTDQYFRYQTHQFGDIHLNFTKVCVHLGYKVVHQWNAQWTLKTRVVWHVLGHMLLITAANSSCLFGENLKKEHISLSVPIMFLIIGISQECTIARFRQCALQCV